MQLREAEPDTRRQVAIAETITSKIENVPPDEAQYIIKERDEAIRAESEGRIAMLRRRQYFYAQEVHQSFAQLKRAITRADGARRTGNVRLEAHDLLDAVGGAHFFRSAVSDYLDHDGKRSPRVMSVEDVSVATYQTVLLSALLSLVAHCAIDAIAPDSK